MGNTRSYLRKIQMADIIWILVLAYALAGLIYLLLKSVLSNDPEIDFKYIWVAGRLWADGINPYSPDFARIGDALVAEDTNRLAKWLYPPNWWVISRTLAMVERETAAVLWRGVNALMILGGTWLILQAFRPLLGRSWAIAGLITLGYVSTMQATPIALTLGQTSILIYFALCSILFGITRQQTVWIIFGLVIVALKPQVGIVIFAGVAALPKYWRAIITAISLILLMCVPSIIAGGFIPTFGGLMDAYLSYDGALIVNSPPEKTGLRHLVDLAFGIELSVILMSLTAALIAWGGGLLMSRRNTKQDDDQLGRNQIIWSILSVIAIGSLHSYDFVIAVPLLLLCFAKYYPAYLKITFALGLGLIYRSSNLAEATGFYNQGSYHNLGAKIDSLASLGLFIAFASIAFWQGTNRQEP